MRLIWTRDCLGVESKQWQSDIISYQGVSAVTAAANAAGPPRKLARLLSPAIYKDMADITGMGHT
jgi:hypothetical protein